MTGWTSARWECRAGRPDRGRNVRVGSGRDYGPRASGLDVASAGLAAFSAGRHSSDLSAPFGHVLTTRPLHGTGLARLGRVLPLGIAPMQAGPICLVVDVSPDQRPDADIPAGLGLPVFIFRTLVAHSNLPYPIWTQVTRRHLGRLYYRFFTEQIKCQEFLGSRPASTGRSPFANHSHRGESHFSSTLVVRTITPQHSQRRNTRYTVETELALKKTA